MTDTEMKRRKAICEAAGVKEIDDVSDGFHTFRQLYYQRMMLFAVIVKQNKEKAWKSLRHEDGELCFGGGWFIVGIDTPEGSYTYHYEDNYYSLFDCEELECGKHWDGHTEKDVTRLLSLPSAQLDYQTDHGYMWLCPECGLEVHSDFERCVRCGHEREAHAEPEIIRCKDCKYQNKGSNESDSWNMCGYFSWGCTDVDDEHFCSYAERKTDDKQ